MLIAFCTCTTTTTKIGWRILSLTTSQKHFKYSHTWRDWQHFVWNVVSLSCSWINIHAMCAMFQHFSFVAAIFFKQRQKIIQVSVSETSSLRSSRGKIFLLILLIENNFIDNIVRKFYFPFSPGKWKWPKVLLFVRLRTVKVGKGTLRRRWSMHGYE